MKCFLSELVDTGEMLVPCAPISTISTLTTVTIIIHAWRARDSGGCDPRFRVKKPLHDVVALVQKGFFRVAMAAAMGEALPFAGPKNEMPA